MRTTCAIVPAFRAAATLERVVRRVRELVDIVIVVDDACPEKCGTLLQQSLHDERVVVLHHDVNRGVGAAVKTGMAEALRRGAWAVVKVDADDQMDVGFVPHMFAFLQQHPEVALIKGNRFADARTLRAMPVLRLIGNSALSFLVKIASGYWTIVDPTNGFIAVRCSALKGLAMSALANRYFFEIDLLCTLGLRRVSIAELEMPAIYGGERSSLSIRHALMDFPRRFIARTIRRLVIGYVVAEISVGTLYGAIGLALLLAGTIFGGIEWHHSIVTGVPRTTGVIVLALLLFMIGFQLLLQAVVYDVQFSPRTFKLRLEDADADERTLAFVAVGSDA